MAHGAKRTVLFYFDASGLLVRTVRWNRTAAGTVQAQPAGTVVQIRSYNAPTP